jgi:hypothetical protein
MTKVSLVGAIKNLWGVNKNFMDGSIKNLWINNINNKEDKIKIIYNIYSLKLIYMVRAKVRSLEDYLLSVL